MSTAENKQFLQRIFAETAKGNGRPFAEALADDACWTIIGSTAWSRTYQGKQDILNNLLRPLGAQLASQMVIAPQRFIAEDDLVVVEARGHNTTQANQPYNNSYCWVCRLRDGKIVELTEYADTQLIESTLSAPHLPPMPAPGNRGKSR
jgi:hypothetical protein